MPYPNYTGEERAKISAAMQEWRVKTGGRDELIPDDVRLPYNLLHAVNQASSASISQPGVDRAAAAAIATVLAERDQGATGRLVASRATPWVEDPNAAAVSASAAETARRLAPGYSSGPAENVTGTLSYEDMGVAAVLEARRFTVQPVRSIDELGGSATVVEPEEQDMSILGSIAKGAVNFISGGAKALLESRRDVPQGPMQQMYGVQPYQEPQYVPGMPSYEASVGGTIIRGVAKGAAALGTAVTAYAAGQAVLQAGNRGATFGGVAPRKKNVTTRICPRGYCLATDGNCYPKAMLPKAMRAWKPDPRPVVSRSDQKAITRAAATKKRLVKLTNAAGAHATITRPHKHTTSKKK